MGDFNLDVERKTDTTYDRRKLTNKFVAATEATGLEYLPTVPTFHSYGRFLDGQVRVQRHSTINQCYVLGVRAAVRALPDATTDHLPLLLVVEPGRVSGSSNSTKNITSRNFKAVKTVELEAALESTWDWGAVHQILGVNELHNFVVTSIKAPLDLVSPLKVIKVKKSADLYLCAETLGVIRERDEARTGTDKDRYRHFLPQTFLDKLVPVSRWEGPCQDDQLVPVRLDVVVLGLLGRIESVRPDPLSDLPLPLDFPLVTSKL
jgi:hypothetical protein